jgi:hypothetical protein
MPALRAKHVRQYRHITTPSASLCSTPTAPRIVASRVASGRARQPLRLRRQRFAFARVYRVHRRERTPGGGARRRHQAASEVKRKSDIGDASAASRVKWRSRSEEMKAK